jgi:hypothetical protein
VRRSARGIMMLELVAALAVTAAVVALGIDLARACRAAARLSAERALAGQIAQGALERSRAGAASGAADLPLPEGVTGLPEARLTLEVLAWDGAPGLRHLRTTVRWTDSRGSAREVTREGLVGDHLLR